jgi:BASS family bile acid:Na+ symporter
MGLSGIAERYLVIILFISIILGLAFPSQTAFLNSYITVFFALILFFTFLKVDLSKMVGYIRKPLLIAYILIIFLIVIPVVMFFLGIFITPETAVVFLLIFGVPPAATNAVLVGIFRGNVPLALLIKFLLYILAPFTLPFLTYYPAGSIITIDTFGLLLTMVQIMILPLIAAQLVKKLFNTKKAESCTSLVAIVMLALLGMGIIGENAAFILSHPAGILFYMALLYPLFMGVGLISYYVAFWLGREDRKTLSISKTFMNGGLVLVLAAQFFGPEAVLIALANLIVWNTSIGAAKYILK